MWFWRLVGSLKEEEKALLLKFSTGSPRLPTGGFANLQVRLHIILMAFMISIIVYLCLIVKQFVTFHLLFPAGL